MEFGLVRARLLRVAAYKRTNTSGNRSISVEAQETRLRDQINQRDWNLVATYTDAGRGGTTRQRTGLGLQQELYATGKYGFVTLHAALTDAGLRTRPTRKRPSQPISTHKLGRTLRDRYCLGLVTHNGQEYPGRHEP